MLIKHFDEINTPMLYECLKLRNEIFIVEQNCIYQDCDGNDTDAYHLMEMDNDGIIAYLRILKPGVTYKEASIGRVLVAPRVRNDGYGRQIMERAMAYIVDKLKYETIRISAQAYLEPFYEKLGFKRVSENYMEDNILHLEMLYELASS